MTLAYPPDYHRALADGARRSAEVIVPLVRRLVAVESVVDVGCGLGGWLAEFQRLGAEDILGIDGDGIDPRELLIPPERFLRRDLTRPVELDRTFDLAVSLEVAEHLPAECADSFVASLTRLAPVVLFSAAVPFQGGLHHLNEQWPEYWAERFRSHGFAAIDAIRPAVWQDDRVEWWYAQNILLFARDEALTSQPALREAWERTGPRVLPLVHPRNYLRCWPS
jgi:SAM-dependent methyltransferase